MYTKLVQVGKYDAEVDIELIDTPEGWSPYLALDDAYKLDDVREALRKGDLDTARERTYWIRNCTENRQNYFFTQGDVQAQAKKMKLPFLF